MREPAAAADGETNFLWALSYRLALLSDPLHVYVSECYYHFQGNTYICFWCLCKLEKVFSDSPSVQGVASFALCKYTKLNCSALCAVCVPSTRDGMCKIMAALWRQRFCFARGLIEGFRTDPRQFMCEFAPALVNHFYSHLPCYII
jgi:hypothetical protein